MWYWVICCRSPLPAETRRGYKRKRPEQTNLYKLLLDQLETFFTHYDKCSLPQHGHLRPEVRRREDETDRCYSEFDCVDEPSDDSRRTSSSCVESKETKPPRDLLELVDYFPGKKLCWASELLEDAALHQAHGGPSG
jgi:hypothetical protein